MSSGCPVDLVAGADSEGTQRYCRIATEEAFTTSDIVQALQQAVDHGTSSLDSTLVQLIYGGSSVAGDSTGKPGKVSSGSRDHLARQLLPRLLDLGEGRIREMDTHGIDMQVLSLAIPGVQMFPSRLACELAQRVNDRLSEAIASHRTRFAGLATFAPQDPKGAVREMERAITDLGLHGFLVNSHTEGIYLDDPRCWPMLEAAEALGAPVYLHPRAPSDGMAAPFRDYRMEGAIWGYGAEAGVHAVRLMLSGVLDRFPKLRLVLGHCGEALPFWLWRLDFMAAPASRSALFNQLRPSEYFRRNFVITTSGVEDPAVLRLCLEKAGVENILWAIDSPFQPTGPAVRFLDTAPISPAERRAIFGENAERVFGLRHGSDL